MSEKFQKLFHQLEDVKNASNEREDKGRNTWGIYDSELVGDRYSMSEYFKKTLPEDYIDMKEYVEDVLAARKGTAIGIEIGGTGSRLFADFASGFFARSVGVVLNDLRDVYTRNKDATRSHGVIQADMFRSNGKNVLKKWLNGEKVDFIVERMFGGLDNFPEDPLLLGHFLNRFYRLLNDNGVLFFASPFVAEPANISAMEFGLEKIKKNGFDISWDKEITQKSSVFFRVRITKHPGSPEFVSFE